MAITVGPGALAWKAAAGDDLVMLDQLQPNIVKGHVREHMSVVFLKFGTSAAGATFLRKIATTAGLMKSARAHLLEVEAHRLNPATVGTVYVGVGLTAAGYIKLGVPLVKQPQDSSFRKGMRDPATRAALGDPALASLEAPYRGDIHCVVVVGDTTVASVNAALVKINGFVGAGVTVVHTESGLAQRNSNGDGIEHFGYVDGRSQPLFLKEDVDDERQHDTGTSAWDPAFSLSRVVVADKAAPLPTKHFGSYFVFRKLEQNVREFKTREEKLAVDLGLTGADVERAGAMIIGRFEDGTPLTMQSGDGMHHPVSNNFNYGDDADGTKCPFLGHIRKVNPRGTGGFEPVAAERLHIMARRGQTFGTRGDNPNDGVIPNKPTKDVGLLFMAFNADISQQFEFAQQTWANNSSFPLTPPPAAQKAGVDLVIAQGGRPPSITCPVKWAGTRPGDNKNVPTVPQTVTMKGGEYFFMPSLAFLRNLNP